MSPLVLFYAFGAMAVLGALIVLLTRNLLYAALGLLLGLLGVAGLFVLVGAPLLAVAQLLVYAGGVLVLMLFGIMAVRGLRAAEIGQRGSRNRFFGGLLTLGVIGLVILLVREAVGFTDGGLPLGTEGAQVREIGFLLLIDYVLAFEIVGLLLLVVLIAALWLASRNTEGEAPAN